MINILNEYDQLVEGMRLKFRAHRTDMEKFYNFRDQLQTEIVATRERLGKAPLVFACGLGEDNPARCEYRNNLANEEGKYVYFLCSSDINCLRCTHRVPYRIVKGAV